MTHIGAPRKLRLKQSVDLVMGGASWGALWGMLVGWMFASPLIGAAGGGALGAGYPLGQWVMRQRTRKDKLSAEQLKRLNEIGFVWRVR